MSGPIVHIEIFDEFGDVLAEDTVPIDSGMDYEAVVSDICEYVKNEFPT